MINFFVITVFLHAYLPAFLAAFIRWHCWFFRRSFSKVAIADRFAGCHGKFFYHLLKQNMIRFDSFPIANENIRLERFDLCYCFDFSFPKLGKRSDIKTFLTSCKKKFLSKYPS